MSIEEINEIVQNYGVKGAIVVILVIVILSFFKTDAFNKFIGKFFDKIIEKAFKKKKKEDVVQVAESDVINHEIFNYIDFWVYSKIPTINFSTDFRTAVFRKYLQLYLKAYKDELHIFVNEGKYKSMDNSQLRTTLLKVITDVIYAYETEMRAAGIPIIVIDKMKAKNLETLNLTLDLTNSICDSQFYNSPNNLLKAYSFLNIILSILENTMASVEDVCNSINGELKGLTMDGFTEE